MTFKESLDYGTEVEKEILLYLQKTYPSANKIEGKSSIYTYQRQIPR
jgi:hypothetical protein